jgi:predicted transcriptional regulator
MSEREQDKQTRKAAMKALREERKAFIKTASVKAKRQKKAIRSIRDQLKDGPKTVPDIAAATGASTAETLWYVAALKKYGEIKEAEKDGGYFSYELTAVKTADLSD